MAPGPSKNAALSKSIRYNFVLFAPLFCDHIILESLRKSPRASTSPAWRIAHRACVLPIRCTNPDPVTFLQPTGKVLLSSFTTGVPQ